MKKDSRISGVYLDRDRLVQFRWSGISELIQSSTPGKEKMVKNMWNSTRADVRRAYWNKYESSDRLDLSIPCPSFGVVALHPTIWDFYVMDANDYGRDKRSIFTLSDGQWNERNVSSLDGSSLSISTL